MCLAIPVRVVELLGEVGLADAAMHLNAPALHQRQQGRGVSLRQDQPAVLRSDEARLDGAVLLAAGLSLLTCRNSTAQTLRGD